MNHYVKFYKLHETIDTDGVIIYTEAKINKEPVNLIIDTGASKTCIGQKCYDRINKGNPNYIKSDINTVGLGAADFQSKLVKIDLLQFNRFKLENIEIVIIDWDNIGNALEQNMNIIIDGVLGCDILNEFNAVIDFGKEKIRFTKPDIL